MVTLRLFAAARQALGIGSMEVVATTVGGVIDAAVAAPGGDQLRSLLPTCTVWLNGDVAAPDTAVVAGDEVAILPPVSGG